MAAMEKHGGPLGKAASLKALPLFAMTADPEDQRQAMDESTPLVEALKEINPDDLSPKQALDALYSLKALAAGCADKAK
jgi:DNA mismatch repair protein MutS